MYLRIIILNIVHNDPYGSGASWSDEVFELFSMLKEFEVLIIFIGFLIIMYF